MAKKIKKLTRPNFEKWLQKFHADSRIGRRESSTPIFRFLCEILPEEYGVALGPDSVVVRRPNGTEETYVLQAWAQKVQEEVSQGGVSEYVRAREVSRIINSL